MLTGILAGLAAGALWGLVFVAPQMVGGLSAVDFTAGRFLSYGALSLVMMLMMRQSAWPNRQQALAAVGLSFLGFTGYYLLLVLAIREAGVEVSSLIIGTIPVWMMLLGKPDGLRWTALLPGLAMTVLGLALMMNATLGATSTSQMSVGAGFWRGVAFALVSMALWTAFGLFNAAWLKRHPEISAAMWANWLGVATGIGALVLWLVGGTELNALEAHPQRVRVAILMVATGIGSAWLATVLWNVASQRLSTSLCGQLIVSETLFALIYSFLWKGHWPNALQVAACILFAAGILASIRAHR